MTDLKKLLDFLNSAGIPYAVDESKYGVTVVIGDIRSYVRAGCTEVIPINTIGEASIGYADLAHEFFFNNGKLVSSRTYE